MLRRFPHGGTNRPGPSRPGNRYGVSAARPGPDRAPGDLPVPEEVSRGAEGLHRLLTEPVTEGSVPYLEALWALGEVDVTSEPELAELPGSLDQAVN